MNIINRIVSSLLAGATLFTMSACGTAASSSTAASIANSAAASTASSSKVTESTAAAESEAASKSAVTTTSGKTLVVYFSATGSTEAVANTIAETLGADTFVITPTEPYTSEDLDWTNNDSRVTREHNDESLQTVELETITPDNWDEYDTVFIGYPIWWGNAAWPVSSFVAANDFTGKTVIPFCTSASSSLGESGSNLAALAGTGDWQEGQRFRSSASAVDVSEWINGLGL